MNSESRICQGCHQEFVIEPEDFAFYERVQVPPPTFCPECRLQRRFMFRNERHLYKRSCANCNKSILATVPSESPYKVFCGSCWWSDEWNPFDYGRTYDPKRPFFEQLKELFLDVPLVALGNNHPTLVESEYVNEVGYAKNCYLIFDADYCEHTRYSTRLTSIKDSMDLLSVNESELCYEDVNCRKSARLFFSEDCSDCIDVYFSKNLAGCTNCFGCVNLRNKSNYLWNKPLSAEEYQKEIGALKNTLASADGLEKLREKARKIWESVPHKFLHGFNNANVSGDYLYNSKNAKDSFQARGLEDSRFCQLIKDGGVKDAYDYTIWGNNVRLVYECIDVGWGANNVKFSFVCALGNTMNTEYAVWCLDVANLFGCSGIRNKKYCILNREYSPEEYETLRKQIITDMERNPYVDSKGRVWKYGEFFPYDLSFYSYNETDAFEHFPIDKSTAIENGWRWREEAPPEHPITMQANGLPERISDAKDEITEEIIGCAECGRGYRIIPADLDFFRRFTFSLPRLCPNCRHLRRFKRMSPMRLWKRKCQCNGEKSENGMYTNTTTHSHNNKPCPNGFETSYSPDRPEIVYCESCYQAEII